MKEVSHIVFHNANCILIEEDDCISLLLKNQDDINNIRPHLKEQKFMLCYKGSSGFNSMAFIERMDFEVNYSIKLFPQYMINGCHTKSFSGFEFTGEAVDDFFSPSGFFFNRLKDGSRTSVNVIYGAETADSWTINFERTSVIIKLSFGDILQKGIASDLMLHSKLTIEFESTSDVQYIYRLYHVIIRFLKMIRYDVNNGKVKVGLFEKKSDKKSYNGYLRDMCTEQGQFYRGNHDVEYRYYKSYIQSFFQFAANNKEYTFYHYPIGGIRFFGRHYSAVDYMNIFSAFESECHANRDLYEKVDASRVQDIKEKIVSQIESYPKESVKSEERDFLNNAKDRIMQLGTQFGQNNKIVNAYHVLHNALDGSVENIFYLSEFRQEGPLIDEKLKAVASFLSKQRGAVAHGGFIREFSDLDAQKIRFLEILTYAQMLKRIGLKDADIERVIGAIFKCNYVLLQEEFRI